MEYFKRKYVKAGESVIDIGSRVIKQSQTSYRPIFSDCSYVGFDIAHGENVDIVGYENLIGCYDNLICGQVLEHVANPFCFVSILPNYFKNYICIIAPCAGKEHRHPLDCWRIFPDGMRELFRYAGIREIEVFLKWPDTIGIGAKYD